MNLLIAVCFGAGVTAFLYDKLGRRAGYTNTKQLVTLMATIFIVATIVFFTILAFLIRKN